MREIKMNKNFAKEGDCENVCTESSQKFQKYKMPSFEELIKIQEKLKPKKESLFGYPIKVFESKYIPKDQLWIIDRKANIFKIINILNSKPYKFILWYQDLFRKIIKLLNKLLK